MASKPYQTDDSVGKPRNFDPKRSYQYVHKFVPMTFTKPAEGKSGTLMMPLAYIEDKSQDEIERLALHIHGVFEMAEQIIDPEKLTNPILLEANAEALAKTTAAIIASNLSDVFFDRAEREDIEALAIKVEVKLILQSEEDEDSLIATTVIKRLMDRFYPIIFSNLSKTQQATEEASRWMWINIFGQALFAIEEQKGTGSIRSMPDEEFDRTFHEFLDRNFADYFEESLSHYSQNIARPILDYVNPAEVPLAELGKWMGVELIKEGDEEPSATKPLGRANVLQPIKINLPLEKPRMAILILDEDEVQVSVREIGADNEVFYRGEGLRRTVQNNPPLLKADAVKKNDLAKKFKFRFCEYVTPFTEKWLWRMGFLLEIEKQAPCVLEELASMLPLRHAIALCRSQWDDLTADEQELVKNKEYGDLLFRLDAWLNKYGLIPRERSFFWKGKPVTGAPGLLQFWAMFVARDTLQYWDEENPNATGKTFVPIGIDVGERELVMAFPHLLSTHISGAATEGKNEWEIKRGQYKEAVINGELIFPPDGFPIWKPFAQTKQEYLAVIEGIARKDMAENPRQKHLYNKGDRSLIESYLKLIKPYCDRLDAHYQQNGYKKLPSVRTAEQQIAWTVQAHVLNKTYESAIDNENSSENVTAQNVRARVLEVLAKLELSPRTDRQRGPRKRGSRHSQ
jgi:hypothetical protein